MVEMAEMESWERKERGESRELLDLKGRRESLGGSGKNGDSGDKGGRGLPGPRGPSSHAGGMYTHWGRNNCSSVHGTELVYPGIAGSSNYGTDALCLPHVPEYSSCSVTGTQSAFGIDYYSHPAGLQNENVPCAVCYTSLRSTIMMIPAKLTGPLSILDTS